LNTKQTAVVRRLEGDRQRLRDTVSVLLRGGEILVLLIAAGECVY
jgi:hypothetical protein